MDDLVRVAREAKQKAYAPYSRYTVGAALRTKDGSIFSGCNIEFVIYSNTIHAEQLALSTAVQEGHREFDAIAISTTGMDGAPPCGLCRQSLAEFCDESLLVLADNGDSVEEYTLGQLLPHGMKPSSLEGE